MSRYKIIDQHGLNFITVTIIDWVDVFIRKKYKDFVLDSLRYCQANKGLEIAAYVIMSSHVHLIVRAAGEPTLSEILRDLKKYTARLILEEIKNGGYESRSEWMLHRFAYRGNTNPGNRIHQFWQSDNHPIELYTLPVILQKLQYIHENPVKEGWVNEPADYPYSSASNYFYDKGLLDVALIDIPLSFVGYLPPTGI
jgi:putative transposase